MDETETFLEKERLITSIFSFSNNAFKKAPSQCQNSKLYGKELNFDTSKILLLA